MVDPTFKEEEVTRAYRQACRRQGYDRRHAGRGRLGGDGNNEWCRIRGLDIAAQPNHRGLDNGTDGDFFNDGDLATHLSTDVATHLSTATTARGLLP